MNGSRTFGSPAEAWAFYFALNTSGAVSITPPAWRLNAGYDTWTVTWVVPTTLVLGGAS